MEIIELPIKALKPYKRNPRKNDKAVEYVANSIRQFGFKVPIVIDENYEIVCGHTRWKAAKVIGLESVPCIMADDLNEDQIRAFRLADNKTAEMADWDFDLLEMEFNDIDPELFDMSDFGFFQDDETEDKAPTEVTEDDFDETAVTEPVCKRGQVWKLGEHRLMCGDSTDAEAVRKLMDGSKADLVFTDPPYNIASDSKNFASDCSKAMEDLSNAEWDKGFDIKNVFPTLFDCLSKDVSVYICTSHFLASEIWAWMKGWADHYSYCVWAKPNPMPSLSKRHWTWNTELICYATRGKHTFNFPKEGHALSSWTIQKKNGNSGHPTEKPVAVPAMGISHSSKQKDLILDLFGGSGSTLIACEQLDRRCFMMEISEHYCDVIIRRWEDFTGQKAELLEE